MLLGALQENLLCLLAFDKQHAQIIRNTVEINLYGGPYKIIATRIYDYIDRFKKPPETHLADILDDKLNADNKREASLFKDVISSIHEVKDGVNAEYVMSQLETFVKRQSLRSVSVDLTKALQRDTEESLAEADELIKKATTKSLTLFDPGLSLADADRALKFLDISETSFPTGIRELDRRGFGPTRKELWLGVANTKGGKSWLLTHLAKMALVHHLKVVHITLEMSESRAAQRYFQAIFSISKRNEVFDVAEFVHDDLGRIEEVNTRKLKAKLNFEDPKIREKLERRIRKYGHRLLKRIRIKEFPTGSLTLPQLQAYLDNLENMERFVPDILIIDYPDLMKLDKDNIRASLDEIFKGIRGIGVARNWAVVAVSQSHRDGAKAKTLGVTNVSEHYGKIFHADTVVTLSRTEQEKALGLARLTVGAGRNDSDGLTVVLSQSLDTGQFLMDSTVLKGNYWKVLPKPEEQSEDE